VKCSDGPQKAALRLESINAKEGSAVHLRAGAWELSQFRQSRRPTSPNSPSGLPSLGDGVAHPDVGGLNDVRLEAAARTALGQVTLPANVARLQPALISTVAAEGPMKRKCSGLLFDHLIGTRAQRRRHVKADPILCDFKLIKSLCLVRPISRAIPRVDLRAHGKVM
jgi:hypothetical protein